MSGRWHSQMAKMQRPAAFSVVHDVPTWKRVCRNDPPCPSCSTPTNQPTNHRLQTDACTFSTPEIAALSTSGRRHRLHNCVIFRTNRQGSGWPWSQLRVSKVLIVLSGSCSRNFSFLISRAYCRLPETSQSLPYLQRSPRKISQRLCTA